jgi:hypothetical protein
MSRPHVCLIRDPAQWGLLDRILPADATAPERAVITWIGLIRPGEATTPIAEIRPVHDLVGMPDLPSPGEDEDALAFAKRLDAANAARRAWFVVQGFGDQSELLARHRARGRTLLEGMVRAGIFESVADDGTPIPHPEQFSIAALGPGATMAHVLVALGIFPSVGQARRNGQTGPLVLGRHVIGKKRIRIEIVP